MYQHPATLDLMASYHRDELLRDAEYQRLAHQVDEEGTPRPGSVQRRVMAVAVAILTIAVVIALI
jgi:hypothetical protein